MSTPFEGVVHGVAGDASTAGAYAYRESIEHDREREVVRNDNNYIQHDKEHLTNVHPRTERFQGCYLRLFTNSSSLICLYPHYVTGIRSMYCHHGHESR